MSHQARHAQTPRRRSADRSTAADTARKTARVLGLGAVAGLGLAAAPAAHAVTAPMPDMGAPQAASHGSAQFGDMHLYPLAGTPLDLLSNNVRVPVGGMDLSTFPLTAPFHEGLPLHALPVIGALLP